MPTDAPSGPWIFWKKTDDSFFLVVSYDEPHGPFLCPKEFWSMYDGYEFPHKANMLDTLEDKPAHHKIWAKDTYMAAAGKISNCSPNITLAAIPLLTTK